MERFLRTLAKNDGYFGVAGFFMIWMIKRRSC